MEQDLDKKIDSWKEQLLDLSKRNKMIKFRETKSKSLPLFGKTVNEFAQLMFEGTTINIRKLEEKEETEDEEEEEYKEPEEIELESDQVVSDRVPEEAKTSLYRIFLKNKESLREKGVDTLYIALSMLKWYEREDSEEELNSPLILLPIKLERENISDTELHNYKIDFMEEGIKINPALRKLLKTEFDIELPPDEEIDLEEIGDTLSEVEEAIGGEKRWEIKDKVVLGIFDFTKYALYEDLEDNREAIKDNNLIKAINDGDPDHLDTEEVDVPKAEDLDEEVPPEETFQVLDADSSQQRAIEAAKAGRSFVLQGPPGTGKSQTIANIISEKLAQGEKVLFVSEKMAALKVVKKRLDDVGLGKFCFEVHGHKANKKRVLSQIEEERNRTEIKKPKNRSKKLEKLKSLREELNAYKDILFFKPGEIDKTVYDVEGILSYLNEVPLLNIDFSSPLQITSEEYKEAISSLEEISEFRKEISEYKDHPWKYTTLTSWKLNTTEKMQSSLESQISVLDDLSELSNRVSKSLEIDINSVKSFENALELLKKWKERPEIDWGQELFESGFEEHEEELRDLASIEKRIEVLKRDINSHYSKEFYNLSPSERLDELKEYGLTRFVSFSYLGEKNKVVKHAKEGYSPGYSAVLEDLKKLEELKGLKEQREEYESLISKLHHLYEEENTDWEVVEELWGWMKEIKSFKFDLSKISELVSEGELGEVPGLRRELQNLCDRWEDASSFFRANMNVSSITLEGSKLYDASFDSLKEHLEKLSEDSDLLKDWIQFKSKLEESEGTIYEEYLDSFLNRDIKPELLVDGFKKAMFTEWMNEVYEQEDLSEFNRKEFDRRLEEFRELDKEQQEIARLEIENRLMRKRPKVDLNHASSAEQVFLDREIKKERRHKPLRELFDKTSNITTTLKPCFMMSPLSVAQYINRGAIEFDVVIFDEASQIMPQDAVSSLIRADQAIIVGDSKQLPPTTFFRAEVEEDEDVREDLESILDEADSVLPSESLLWHYRSRDDDLISFSNHMYYGNRLNTFPGNDPDTYTGIDFIYVEDGVYDRGGSRQNVPEAEKVVDKVEELVEEHSDKSIGVVAFSSAQETAIQEEIERRRRKNKALDAYISGKKELEEFFVKRLEIVQGDERDIMIFSVGYGPDSTGKVTMNFGPLNNKGGERRLNVAVTRAKERVILFSSLQPSEIDLSRTGSTGVEHFKKYLEYAKKGRDVLKRDEKVSQTLEFDSGFEEAVYNALVDAGFDVHTQVQSSGYSIDLAIRHPEKPGKFILGIECDGAAYHSSKTARDRDRLRQQVLEGLGWNIHRIWSPDWVSNQSREIEKIEEKVEEILDRDSSHDLIRTTSESPESEKIDIEEVEGAHNDVVEYNPAELSFKKDKDFENIAHLSLHNSLRKIVRQDGPVEKHDAYLRIIGRWGITKVGKRIERKMDSYVSSSSTAMESNGFLWPEDPDDLDLEVRINSEDDERSIEEISIEELAKGIFIVLENGFSIERSDLVLETARLFNFSRVGSNIRERINNAIDWLLGFEEVEEEGEMVKIKREADIDNLILEEIY